eukprot:gene11347-biopygen494
MWRRALSRWTRAPPAEKRVGHWRAYCRRRQTLHEQMLMGVMRPSLQQQDDEEQRRIRRERSIRRARSTALPAPALGSTHRARSSLLSVWWRKWGGD